MSSTTIQRILEDAVRKNRIFEGSSESAKWFIERARRTNINSSKLIREYNNDELRTTSQLKVGRMYMFFYDPKWKDTLPFYDRFPCIFLTDMWRDKSGKVNFAGINLHYLPYKQRALLMDALLDLQNHSQMPENKKLNISYGILKKAAASKWFAPTYKRYLKGHVKSRLVNVPYEEWPIAALLPVAEWEKKTQAEIWADALRKIQK